MDKNKPLLIFDFDGTLVDSLNVGLKISNQLANQYGYEKIDTLEVIREHSAINFIKNHISWYKIPFWLMHIKREIMYHLKDIYLYPNIEQILERLSLNYNLGIIGGGPKGYHQKLIEILNINYFVFIESNNASFKSKRIKKFFKHFDRNKIVMIGDDTKDIEAAHKAGIKIISVSWGSTSRKILEKHHPDRIIDHPDELEIKIKELF